MAMDDITKAMWEAWERVGPMLKANPDELKARLARRRSKMYARPPRAMCLAVRASDTRIEPYRWAMVPEDAMDVGSEWHEGRKVEHTVELNKKGLVKICEAVEPVAGGWPAYMLAKELGCSYTALEPLRRNGTFQVEVLKGWSGRRGKGTAFLRFERTLDPAARGRARPDHVWGGLWTLHAESLPDDFSYTLTRAPNYVMRGGKELFRGWKWICPGCKKTARTLYYPLPIPDWGQWVGFPCNEDEVDAVPRPKACFACDRCHGVLNFTRSDLMRSWGRLILHLSGGLLYGKEVRRPEWLKPRRKLAYKARRRKAPLKEEMARLLGTTGMTIQEIAREVGMKAKSAKRVAYMVYERYGAKGREDLRERYAAEKGDEE